MHTVKISILSILITLPMSVFSQVPATKIIQCPPASAIHHYAPGQSWTLDSNFQAEGWYVMQDPWSNWSNITIISDNSPLSIRIVDEGVYLKNDKNKLHAVSGLFPITCGYVYKTENNRSESIFVKSIYSSYPDYTMSTAKDKFEYQIDEGQDGKNWGWVCITTAGTPQVCPIGVYDPIKPVS